MIKNGYKRMYFWGKSLLKEETDLGFVLLW